MAKRKSRFSKFLGALTGTPYDKLLKQIEKLPEINEDDKDLSKEIRRFVKIITKAHKDERIDDEENDLLVKELEDIDHDIHELQEDWNNLQNNVKNISSIQKIFGN